MPGRAALDPSPVGVMAPPPRLRHRRRSDGVPPALRVGGVLRCQLQEPDLLALVEAQLVGGCEAPARQTNVSQRKSAMQDPSTLGRAFKIVVCDNGAWLSGSS